MINIFLFLFLIFSHEHLYAQNYNVGDWVREKNSPLRRMITKVKEDTVILDGEAEVKYSNIVRFTVSIHQNHEQYKVGDYVREDNLLTSLITGFTEDKNIILDGNRIADKSTLSAMKGSYDSLLSDKREQNDFKIGDTVIAENMLYPKMVTGFTMLGDIIMDGSILRDPDNVMPFAFSDEKELFGLKINDSDIEVGGSGRKRVIGFTLDGKMILSGLLVQEIDVVEHFEKKLKHLPIAPSQFNLLLKEIVLAAKRNASARRWILEQYQNTKSFWQIFKSAEERNQLKHLFQEAIKLTYSKTPETKESLDKPSNKYSKLRYQPENEAHGYRGITIYQPIEEDRNIQSLLDEIITDEKKLNNGNSSHLLEACENALLKNSSSIFISE